MSYRGLPRCLSGRRYAGSAVRHKDWRWPLRSWTTGRRNSCPQQQIKWALGALEGAWPAHCCEAELLHIPNVTSPHARARQVEAALFLEAGSYRKPLARPNWTFSAERLSASLCNWTLLS